MGTGYHDDGRNVKCRKPIRLNRWFIETGFGTDQMTVIQNIKFTKEVFLRDMKMYGFAFKNMIFEEALTFNGHNRRSWFRFNDSTCVAINSTKTKMTMIGHERFNGGTCSNIDTLGYDCV